MYTHSSQRLSQRYWDTQECYCHGLTAVRTQYKQSAGIVANKQKHFLLFSFSLSKSGCYSRIHIAASQIIITPKTPNSLLFCLLTSRNLRFYISLRHNLAPPTASYIRFNLYRPILPQISCARARLERTLCVSRPNLFVDAAGSVPFTTTFG